MRSAHGQVPWRRKKLSVKPVQLSQAPHTFKLGRDHSAVLAHFLRPTPTTPRRPCRSCAAARDFKDHALSPHPVGRRGWRADRANVGEVLARVEDLGASAHHHGPPQKPSSRCWPTRRSGRRCGGRNLPRLHHNTTQARTERRPARGARAARRRVARGRVVDPWPRRASRPGLAERCLLDHFHDILPGLVHREVHGAAARRRNLAEVEAAAVVIRDRLAVGEVVNTVGVAGRAVVSVGDGLRFAEAPSGGRGLVQDQLRYVPQRGSSATGFTLESERLPPSSAATRRLPFPLISEVDDDPRRSPPGNVQVADTDGVAEVVNRRLGSPRLPRRRPRWSSKPLGRIVFDRPIGRASRMGGPCALDAESSRLKLRSPSTGTRTAARSKVRFPVSVHAPRRPKCASRRR